MDKGEEIKKMINRIRLLLSVIINQMFLSMVPIGLMVLYWYK